ncbi:MAG TPA: hypothetical protein VJT49_14090 [Amycolatopsis sp.]|uniref:hypothetical protein n=1 Tax=Amycolatopsis sp. TaxID=37632 RepID=UPI002B482701|nr:hypothetical protein [Amycolatopsis sp.]HKS46212.1 hypothetical protein [Amycolatopsis sp.]
MRRKAITTEPDVPNLKSFDEPSPDVTEDAFHLDDLFMLLDYYTLPGGDDWPDRFPAFPEYVIDCYRRYASFPFRTGEALGSLPDEASTLAGQCLSLLDPDSEALHEEIGNLLEPVMAQVKNRRAFARRWLEDVLADLGSHAGPRRAVPVLPPRQRARAAPAPRPDQRRLADEQVPPPGREAARTRIAPCGTPLPSPRAPAPLAAPAQVRTRHQAPCCPRR